MALHPRVVPAEQLSVARFAAAVALACLVSSPVSLFGEPSDQLTQDQKSLAVEKIAAAIQRGYVFEDKAEEISELLNRRLEQGGYDDLADLGSFADQLTTDLQSINHDLHLRVTLLPPPDETTTEQPDPVERRRQIEERARLNNYGFERVERLPGNVGYVELRGFIEASLGRDTAVAAMNFLASTDAVIFDLRQNGGGSPSMIQLLSSYLFADRVHLNSFYVRGAPRNQEFWTEEEVAGPKMVDHPVYVLTSSFTFSAAEEFTYNLKNMKRATIIGETTGGGAHPVTTRQFPDLGLQVSVPFGRAINPISGTNWEGTGVEPDKVVPAEDALRVAHAAAVRGLLEKPELSGDHRTRLEWTLEGLGALEKGAAGSDLQVDARFGDRRVFSENGSLFYERGKRPRQRLIDLGNSRYCFDELESQRLTLGAESGGGPSALLIEYSDGRRQSIPRTN